MGKKAKSRGPKMTLQEKVDKIIACSIIAPGKINHISVQHDPGCPALRTQNIQDCTCDPDVMIMEPDA
jgi:hypothetical protein